MSQETDRVIIRTMRMALWGIVAILFFFLAYVAALVIASSRDNRRMDAIEKRLDKIERRAEAPP